MGLGGWIRRYWIALTAAVVVIVLVLAAVFVWPGLSGTETASDGGTTTDSSTSDQVIPEDPPVSDPTPQIVPMTPSEKAPTPEGIARQLADPLANGRVADLSGIVIDPVTGETLWSQNSAEPQIPASSMKLLTAAALLISADPTRRLQTTVVKGMEPGTIVFVGGGDVTLSARPEGDPSVLPGGPTVAELAAQVKASGVEVTKILLDTSYWSGPEMADGWSADDITGTPQDAHGYITRMQALMVDADRLDPNEEDSIRTGTPAMTAGKKLAQALGVDDVPIEEGTAPDDAEVLAKVQSQPLTTLIAQSLERSDNVLAEALAREIAITRGAPPSFEGVSAAVMEALSGDPDKPRGEGRGLGLDTTGVVIKDGSGMSAEDRVPSAVLGKVMAMAVAGEPSELSSLLIGLPLAGVSGTLAPPRFSQPQNKQGAGWVRAKTGSIASTYALVGYVPDVDGRIIAFAFNSNGVYNDPETGTRPALDALAASLRMCGCQ